MKIKDNYKSYILLFLIGILAGILCRLSDFFPYESLWSLSSISTMFGFWIASVGVITYFSPSNKGASINSLLYMFGMTLSFYGLQYILGFFMDRYSSEFGFVLYKKANYKTIYYVTIGVVSAMVYFVVYQPFLV